MLRREHAYSRTLLEQARIPAHPYTHLWRTVVGALPRARTSPRNHPLRELELLPYWVHQPGDRPTELAHFLDGIFPNLDVQGSRHVAGLTYMPRGQEDKMFMAEVWNEIDILRRRGRERI